jgi:hypothetical protein
VERPGPNNEITMSRVEVKERWFVDGEADTVRDAVRTFFKVTGFKIVEEEGHRFRVTQGSQLWTRLLGGWFVSAATLPKAATVSVRPSDDRVLVRALVEETLGFGILDPLLADKYRGFFEDWVEQLVRVTEDAGTGAKRPRTRKRKPGDDRLTGGKEDRVRRRDTDEDE